jgi:5-methylcytosine-specific restriction endonuclease McrA
MSAPKHICAERGCPVLVERGRTRCPAHERAYDLRRGSAQDRGYDARWAAFSRAWRQRFPWCGMRADGQLHTDGGSLCAQQDLKTRAQCVDHLVAIRNGGSQYDESNLESKCLQCSGRKRVLVDGGFGRE